MSGLTIVYVTFAIVATSILGYLFLIARRHREVDDELAVLTAKLGETGEPRPVWGSHCPAPSPESSESEAN